MLPTAKDVSLPGGGGGLIDVPFAAAGCDDCPSFSNELVTDDFNAVA